MKTQNEKRRELHAELGLLFDKFIVKDYIGLFDIEPVTTPAYPSNGLILFSPGLAKDQAMHLTGHLATDVMTFSFPPDTKFGEIRNVETGDVMNWEGVTK